MIRRLRDWWAGKRCLYCRACETHYVAGEGIGGKCIKCGTIHGWVTEAELRAYSERMEALRLATITRLREVQTARKTVLYPGGEVVTVNRDGTSTSYRIPPGGEPSDYASNQNITRGQNDR